MKILIQRMTVIVMTAAAVYLNTASAQTLAQSGTVIDDFQYYPGGNSAAFGITIAPNGTIFAGGFGGSHGIVRGSFDGGATWTLLDDFAFAGIQTRYAGGMAADSAGN